MINNLSHRSITFKSVVQKGSEIRPKLKARIVKQTNSSGLLEDFRQGEAKKFIRFRDMVQAEL